MLERKGGGKGKRLGKDNGNGDHEDGNGSNWNPENDGSVNGDISADYTDEGSEDDDGVAEKH